MSSFSMAKAQVPGKKTAKQKLNPGTHVCVVTDIKEHQSQIHGMGFFLEFYVESGPSANGMQGEFVVFPDNVRASGRMPRETAYQRELGKIQKAVGAVYGFTAAQSAVDLDDAKYQAAIARPVSPLRGSKIIVEAIPHVNAKGEQTVYYEILPVMVTASAPANTNAVKPTPKTPGKVTASKTFAQAASAAGFVVHPDDSDFFFSEETEEVVAVDELKSRLGY